MTKEVVDHGGVVDLAGDPARTRALAIFGQGVTIAKSGVGVVGQ